MKKTLLFLTTILVLCACSARKQKKWVIGVSQCSEDIWRDKLNSELEMGTYQHEGVALRFASANDNDKLQAQQIDSFISQGVDLLIVSPNQIHTISKAIDRAYDHGIPVILFDRKSDSQKYTAFIGADNHEAGYEMGQFIAQKLNGAGMIAEIEGLKGSSPSIERHRGFMAAIGKYPGIKVVKSYHGDWQEESAYRLMDSLLSAYPKVNYVFAQNDRMASGARKRAIERGFKHINFVGIDALPVPGGGIEQVKNGQFDASYIYPTRGDLVMQLALNILEKKPFKRDNYLKGALVTPDNANVLLMQSEEMGKQSQRLKSLHGKVNNYLAEYQHQKIYLILFTIIVFLVIIIITYVQRTLVQQHKTEEMAVKSKLNFFTNISHELRTPLTLIAEPVNNLLAEGDKLTVQQRRMLDIADRNVSILVRLVNEILDFRKVQDGKMGLTLSDFNLAEAVEGWVFSFSTLADKRNITLKIDAPEQIQIRADVAKIERICYNLMSNAIKYTHQGGLISVQLRKENDTAVLRITDSGDGIPAAELPKIFTQFYQAGNARGGTGIGLALVKAFAELHKGSVSVESELQKGSTFTVVLPLTQPGSLAEEVVSPTLQEVIKPEIAPLLNADRHINELTAPVLLDKPELLIIDDNADIRSYLQTTLSPYYKISEAGDGKKGLEVARKVVPDIILCDVMMPVMNGFEFCKALREDTAISHIPVILLTSMNLEEQRTEGYESGADAYLVKPFSLNTLVSRINNLLKSRKRLAQQAVSESEKGYMEELSTPADKTFVAHLRKVIQENLADSNLTVEKVGDEVGLSRVQLYRKVKALTGYSSVEMIRKARLERARRLLQTTEKSISEVAYAVGFTSPSYFSKCYKEEFGQQPGQER